MSVIDGAACNGSTGRGCGRVPRTIKVGSGAFWVTVDQARDAVYVASNNDGTVSVINGARCNAKNTSGCARTPPDGDHRREPAEFVAVDRVAAHGVRDQPGRRHAVGHQYQDVQRDGHVRLPEAGANRQAAFSPPSGYNPNAFALIPRTGTAYLVNVGGENFLSLTMHPPLQRADTPGAGRGRRACRVMSSCCPPTRPPAPSTAATQPRPDIDVFNSATCNAAAPVRVRAGREDPDARSPGQRRGDRSRHGDAVRSDPSSGKVSVISTASCNAADTAGCAARPPDHSIGPAPVQPVLDKATRTLYVPTAPQETGSP